MFPVHRIFLGLPLVFGLCALPAAVLGETLASPAIIEPLREAGDCPQLFGTLRSRKVNAEVRSSQIHWVEEEKAGITLAHSHNSWIYPTHLIPKGVTLRQIKEVDQTNAVGVLQLHQELAQRMRCPAGEYSLKVDDFIGGQIKILAVLKNFILVSYENHLGYLSLPKGKKPNWLMAWRPHGTIPTTHGSSSPAQNAITPVGAQPRQAPSKPHRAPRPIDIKR